ncbi:hypothetical protein QJS10_CPA05g02284 [Acorus calamus]|uniref:Uncharacterized protein n=1 Tax=Acorus calamus TaxID=4465 RepID=A0AAV9EVC3_ACOCL|nr:hypothetical protein QJS10_CPA05g02284 [Acorus calamus]
MRRVLLCGKRIRKKKIAHVRDGRSSASNMVLKKLMKLRKIVPTCEEADIDTLFRKTAEHIALLELQVSVLEGLSSLYGV